MPETSSSPPPDNSLPQIPAGWTPDDYAAIMLLNQGIKNIQDHALAMQETYMAYEAAILSGTDVVLTPQAPATSSSGPPASAK